MGARLSDHGLESLLRQLLLGAQAASAIFDKARARTRRDPRRARAVRVLPDAVLRTSGCREGLDEAIAPGRAAQRQHRAGSQTLGPDTGFDSIGDWPQIDALGAYLDRLEQENALPKTILYNLNPADNYAFATMIGNFQDGKIPARCSSAAAGGSSIRKKAWSGSCNALSNTGLLSRFVGMLTDSRSFMSYPRHEYFRRVLCNWLGGLMESGELPHDMDLVGTRSRTFVSTMPQPISG